MSTISPSGGLDRFIEDIKTRMNTNMFSENTARDFAIPLSYLCSFVFICVSIILASRNDWTDPPPRQRPRNTGRRFSLNAATASR